MSAPASVEDSQSERFKDGDVTIRSSDRVLFRVHKVNLAIASEAFPSIVGTSASSDEVVDFTEDAKTLDILFHFAYPSRPIPNLGSLSFKELMEVAEAAGKWGLNYGLELSCFHLQKYACNHSEEILRFAGRYDSEYLVAAVAPYLVTMPTDAVAALGVSSKTCVKWGIYREKWIFALLEGENVIMSHESCSRWSMEVKPYLPTRLDIGNGVVSVPAKRNKETLGVQDIYRNAVEGRKNANPGQFSFVSQCCKSTLEKWQSCMLDKIDALQFSH
jgi:hypothetical protein